MQTFDQSLMALLKQGLITYEEAVRQATNPDDFALRYSGIASTSDSKWDGFEGAAAPAAPPPARTPTAPVAAPRTPGPAAPARPAAPKPEDDDFQIERF
jgi:twitching motility protein PilT